MGYAQKLPSYTTERYYLLSELDDCSACNESLSDLKIPGEVYFKWFNNANNLVVIYTLWQVSNGVNALYSAIYELFGEGEKINSNRLLAIEALAKVDGDAWNELQKVAVNAVDRIAEDYKFGCVLIGLSDDCSGAPALDTTVSCIMHTPYKTSRVISLKPEDYLGHDPTREPDAGEDVNQYLIASTDPLVWVERSFPTLGGDGNKKVDNRDRVHESFYRFEFRQFLYLLLGVIVFLFLWYLGLLY